MAAVQLSFSLVLCLLSTILCQSLINNRIHVSMAGDHVTVVCPPHNDSYTTRMWTFGQHLLRPTTIIYSQENGGPVNDTGARPDISLNLTDWRLTIRNLQLKDNGVVFCDVLKGGLHLYTYEFLYVYDSLVEVKYNTTVTLQCPGADARLWFSSPLSPFALFSQNTSGVTKHFARDNMHINPRTFELTVTNVRYADYRWGCGIAFGQTDGLHVIFAAVYNVVVEAEEGTSATLPCDEVQRRTNQSLRLIRLRDEPYTREWQRVNGDTLYLLYRYAGVFYEHRSTLQDDIALNNATFALTIGKVQPEDNMILLVYSETPRFTNVNPNMGPLSGGTMLTLTGSSLNVSDLTIKLADVECPTTIRNMTVALCITPHSAANVLNAPLSITITWNGGTRVHDLMQTFTYKTDPTITKLEPTDTIISGGTRVTVTGDGFNVVGEARFQVNILHKSVLVRIFQSVCQILSATTLYCPVPKIDIFGRDGKIDLSALTATSPRKRREVKLSRHLRQAEGNVTGRVVINNDEIDFRIGVLLDGVPTYRNLTEALPEYSQMTVYSDPVIYRWTELKVLTSTNRTLQVKGSGLLTGIQSTDYRMLIGQSECNTLDVYTNVIVCAAPRDFPTPHHNDTVQGLYSVRVHIGVFKEPFLVGTLHYKVSFFDDPVAKWGIISAAVVVGAVIVIVTVICIVKKCGKMRHP